MTNRLQEGNSDAKTNTRDGCSRPLAPNNSAMHSFPLLNKFLHLILNLAFQQQLARFCACNSLPTHMYLSAMFPASQAAVCPLLGTHTTVAGHTTTMQNFEENGQGQHDPHPLEKAGAHLFTLSLGPFGLKIFQFTWSQELLNVAHIVSRYLTHC